MPIKYDPRTALTGAGADARVSQWGHRGFIKSIQYGTVTIVNPAVTGTATITSVNTGNAYVQYLGSSQNSEADPSKWMCRVALTNSTTVTGTMNTSSTQTPSISFVVIEFMPGIIKSLQQGTVSTAAGIAGTTTITAVDTTKTILVYGGSTTDNASPTANVIMARITLTNSTTVSIAIGFTCTAIAGFTAVEFF